MPLQWGHDEGVVENLGLHRRPQSSVNSFNGATTKESWKTKLAACSTSLDVTLQWGHDEGVVENFLRKTPSTPRVQLQWGHDEASLWKLDQINFASVDISSFNGATTKESVENEVLPTFGQVEFRSLPGATTKESWKTIVDAVECPRKVAASMGPRRRSRGKHGSRMGRTRGHTSFNGATTKESWKTC